MKKLLTLTISVLIISCGDNEQKVFIEDLNCSVSTDKYVNFKIGDEVVCWTEANPVRIDNSGSGDCGLGYENIKTPYLSTGIRGYVCNPSSDNCLTVDRSIIFHFTRSCSSFDTQDKFYNLIQPGDYELATSTTDFGKFFIEYYENGVWYNSKVGNQKDSKVMILEVKRIAPTSFTSPDGSINGTTAGFDVTLKASFNLYNENGQLFKRVSGSTVKGLMYRPTPYGILWDDYYGE